MLSRYFKEPVRSLYAVNLLQFKEIDSALSPQICVSFRDRCVQKLPKSADLNNKSKRNQAKAQKRHALSLNLVFPSQFPENPFRSKQPHSGARGWKRAAGATIIT